MTHPAPDEMLADFAAGATTPGLSLLLAVHLTQCPEARRRLDELEGTGGAMMAEATPEPISEAALDRALAAIDRAPAAARPEPTPAPCQRIADDDAPLPRPLAERIGSTAGRIRWQFRLPGLAEYPLDGFEGERVSLVRARPGTYLPQHTHRGLEATLVLQGCLRDEDVDFRAGDLSVSDESIDHRPVIIGPQTCYCLLVLQAPMRFTGRLSRALNLLSP